MYSVKVLQTTDDRLTIGGYGVVFGGRDLEGEAFAPDTNYMLDLVPVKPVLYEHGRNAKTELARLGSVTDVEQDEIGLFVTAEIDRAGQYASAVERLIDRGVLGWSSGSISHMTRRDGAVIKAWPIVEFSLTPTPAEPRTRGVDFIKSVKHVDPALAAFLEAQQDSAADAAQGTKSNSEGTHMEDKQQMDLSPVLTAIAGIADSVKALGARVDGLDNGPVTSPGIQAKGAPAVITDTDHWKYDNIGGDDLALAAATLDSARRSNQSRGGASVAMFKALAHRIESNDDMTDSKRAARHAFKSAGFKANEINQSTLANYGDEWVGVYYSGALWQSIRHEASVLSMLPTIEVPAGAESIVMPLESADPTWYKVAQSASLSSNPGGIPTNTVTSSNLGTASQTMTLAKLGARVLWTGELEEDAVLPYVAQLRAQLATSAAEYLESAIIDGDTDGTATTNINDIAGTPAATDWFMTVNGFRKLALVTNTANSRDGGALTSADFLETVKLMGVGGANAQDINKVGFLIGPHVHYKALELADVKTRDVFSGATIENGRLNRIYGYPIHVTYHMHKAQPSRLTNTAGKIDLDTAGNNTKGAILAVRFDQWRFGYRRRMTLETTRVPAADATEIVALMRFGLTYRDNEASAISYNITV